VLEHVPEDLGGELWWSGCGRRSGGPTRAGYELREEQIEAGLELVGAGAAGACGLEHVVGGGTGQAHLAEVCDRDEEQSGDSCGGEDRRGGTG